MSHLLLSYRGRSADGDDICVGDTESVILSDLLYWSLGNELQKLQTGEQIICVRGRQKSHRTRLLSLFIT